MKIAILGTRGFPNVQGGVEKHCEQLSIRLAQLGCQVTVYVRMNYVDRNLRSYKGVKLMPLLTIKIRSLETIVHTFLAMIVILIRRPDILHFQGIGPAIFSPLAKLFKLKVVVTTHGSNYKHPKWGRYAKRILKICESTSMRFADRVIAVSPIIAEEVKTNYCVDASIITNGVMMPECAEDQTILSKLKLKKNGFILAVGRLDPVKGFEVLIDAFKIADLPDCKLVIAGGVDNCSAYSIGLIRRSGQNENVVFCGFMTEKQLAALYKNAALFVLPSYYEGLPIVLLEAMNCGASCIVSDIPGNRNMPLKDERYFEAGNCKDLTELLNKFVRQRLGEKERLRQIKFIHEKFNWPSKAKQTYHIYRELLS